ncbi:MAG: Ldh family oxidoreductase [Rectinemataceae bacterium]
MENIDAIINKRVMPAALESWCRKAMEKSGLQANDAARAASVFTSADTWGIHSHGTRQIRGLMLNVKDGRIDPAAKPETTVDWSATAIIDGHDAMPTSCAIEGMELAMAKAAAGGIGYVGVKNSSHIGALSYYSLMAAKRGMIGVAMTNTDPWMTVPGGKGPIMGTNPISYGIPTGTDKPIFLDIATSSVAVTKILALKAMGKMLPDKWLVDEHGVPTDDPKDYPEKGALLPMAGHKGYGIALLVETLSSVITGAAMLSGVNCWLNDTPKPANEGHAFIAIDIAKLMPKGLFFKRLAEMTDEIKRAPKADGMEKIFMPGEIEHGRREKAEREGLTLPDYVLVNLESLAKDIGDVAAFHSMFFSIAG